MNKKSGLKLAGQVELELTDAEIELTLLQMGRDRSYRLSAAN